MLKLRFSLIPWLWSLLFIEIAIIQRSAEEGFPFKACKTSKIDLLLVTDPKESAMASSTKTSPKTYQMSFFKGLVDVFLNEGEYELNRLRVAMVSTEVNPFSYFKFGEERDTFALQRKIANSTDKFDSSSYDSLNVLAAIQRTHTLIKDMFAQYGRKNSAFLVVWVFDGDYAEEANTLSQNSQEIKYFFIVPYPKSSVRQDITNSNNMISLKSFSDLERSLTIPISLCGNCAPGWSRFEPEEPQGKPISCYRVFDSDKRLHWRSASSLCSHYSGELLGVKSEEELEFLRFWLFHEIRQVLTRRDHEEAGDIGVYIGLKRDLKRMDKRFRWSNGLPLVLTQWAMKQPSGGHIRGCGMWVFNKITESELLTNDFLNVSGNNHDYSEGWVAVGCGEMVTSLYACQVTLSPQFRSGATLEMVETSKKSFLNALALGDVVSLNERLFSASVLAKDNVLATQYEWHSLHHGSFTNRFDCTPESNAELKEFIAYTFVCDYTEHCSNGRDETNCLYRTCKSSEFTCVTSKQCVPRNALCDLYNDCQDGSDEERCTECTGYLCCDGTCQPRHWYLEGKVECSGCSSWSDSAEDDQATEAHFLKTDCTSPCLRTEGVTKSPYEKDNASHSVRPQEDYYKHYERLETINSCSSQQGDLLWAPKCVKVQDRFGGDLGCRDMSHLRHCEGFSCPEGYVKCPNSFCIPLNLVRDGTQDCPYGEDEYVNSPDLCWRNFVCDLDSSICVHPDSVCDNLVQCPDGQDELNCLVTCERGFECLAGTVSNYEKSKVLTSLAFIHTSTKYLDLSNIDLSLAFPHDVPNVLINLFEMRLRGCRIRNVESKSKAAASDLATVFRMDLSANLIEEITSESIFKYMKNLHELNLSQNILLTTISTHAFLDAENSVLEKLDLSFTSILILHNEAFVELKSLSFLNLSHTLITNIAQYRFSSRITLDMLDLGGNSITEFTNFSFQRLTVTSYLHSSIHALCCPEVLDTGVPDICHAPRPIISSCSDLLGQTFQRVCLWTLGLLALFGNAILLRRRIALSQTIVKEMRCVFLTNNMIVANLLMGTYALIIASADIHFRKIYLWNHLYWTHGSLCRFSGFLATLSTETSIFFLFLITLDRLVVIRCPLKPMSFSKFATGGICSCVWFLGILMAAVPLLPRFSHWQVYSANSMCLGLPLRTDLGAGKEFSIAVFIGVNSLVYLLIALGQLLIYRGISQNKTINLYSNALGEIESKQADDDGMTKQLMVIAGANFLCYFPLCIMGYRLLDGTDIGEDAYLWSTIFSLPVSAIISPIIHSIAVLFNKWDEFKSGVKRKRTGKSVKNAQKIKVEDKFGIETISGKVRHVNNEKSAREDNAINGLWNEQVERIEKKYTASNQDNQSTRSAKGKTIAEGTGTNKWEGGVAPLLKLIEVGPGANLEKLFQKKGVQSMKALIRYLQKKGVNYSE